MKKLLHVTFAVALIFSVASTSFATTWAPHDVVCPVCKHKNTFMTPMSFGNYIYQWPSKFQYIYWPLIDSPVLYSCSQCHYTAFMFDFNDLKPDKVAKVKKMLAEYPFEGTYDKYTDIPMSKRLAIAEKVYEIIGQDDDWWCRFERVKGYHLAGEKKKAEAAVARKRALELAEKILREKQKSPSEKELFLITGGMRYFLDDHAGALKDLEHALTLKFQSAEVDKEKTTSFDNYLSDVVKQFIAAIKDEEKAKTEPIWPHRVLEGHKGWVMNVAYSPDGNFVASADIDDGLKIWDGRTGTLKHTFPNRNVIQHLTFSPDSKLLVTGGYNKTIDLWDVQTNTLVKALTGHGDYVDALEFSPDGKLLASGSWDDTMKIWNVATWSVVHSLPHPESVWSISFSPDGTTLASIDFKGTVRLFDTNSWKVRRQFKLLDTAGFVVFSPDGKLLALMGNHGVALVDPATGKVVRDLSHPRSPQAAAFSPDGKRLASVSWDGTLRLWNVSTGEQLEILTERGGQFRDVKFAPDGLTIVTSSNDSTVRLWDVRPGVKAVAPQANPQ